MNGITEQKIINALFAIFLWGCAGVMMMAYIRYVHNREVTYFLEGDEVPSASLLPDMITSE
jgi:hypothetical protein